MMRKSVAILTPDGGVWIELPQRIRQQADSGHDVQERDLDDFVPLERSLKLPTQHSISDEGAGVLLEINCILGHMIGDLLGHHRPGQLLPLRGQLELATGRQLGRGVLSPAHLLLGVSIGELRPPGHKRRTGVRRDGRRLAAHSLRGGQVTHFCPHRSFCVCNSLDIWLEPGFLFGFAGGNRVS